MGEHAMRTALLCGASAAVLFISAGAGPAGAAETSAAAASSSTAVAEVIVTAQKREQRLQDVPVAVTVLNTVQLQQTGVRSVKDLTQLTPGLNATTTGDEATTTVRIRGVGTVADNAGLEHAVGIYIDGVYRPRNGVSFNNLGELSDVQVLKGPQGTLFGKNIVAGVILITTKRPSVTFGGEAEVTVQNYNGYSDSASVTGPLVKDVLAARLYIADTNATAMSRSSPPHRSPPNTTSTSSPSAANCCSGRPAGSTSILSAITRPGTTTAAPRSIFSTASPRACRIPPSPGQFPIRSARPTTPPISTRAMWSTSAKEAFRPGPPGPRHGSTTPR
jgi:outer membrane receptor protein involved in Fe transport